MASARKDTSRLPALSRAPPFLPPPALYSTRRFPLRRPQVEQLPDYIATAQAALREMRVLRDRVDQAQLRSERNFTEHSTLPSPPPPHRLFPGIVSPSMPCPPLMPDPLARAAQE